MKYQRRIIKIGNAQGIILPKTLLDLARLEEAFYLDVEVGNGKITLTQALKSPRK